MKIKFDPRTVFLSSCFLIVSFIFMNNVIENILCVFVALMHSFLLGLKIKNLFKILTASLFLFLSIILINYFIAEKDLYYIFNSLLRLILIIILASVFISSLDIMDIGFAIEKIFYHLKYIKIPIESISAVIALSLKFIPLMKDEALRIQNAQKARGLDYSLMSIKDKIKNITALFIPIVVSSIQTSIHTANAMEVRGYSAPYKKTRLYEHFLTAKDIFYISFTALFMIVIIFIKQILDNISMLSF